MTSKHVASLLKSWIDSEQFGHWSDYWAKRVIETLEQNDFEFDQLTPKKRQEIDFSIDEESTIDVKMEVTEPVKPIAKKEWLIF